MSSAAPPHPGCDLSAHVPPSARAYRSSGETKQEKIRNPVVNHQRVKRMVRGKPGADGTSDTPGRLVISRHFEADSLWRR